MPKYIKHLITLTAFIIVASFLVFLYDTIVSLSLFAGRLTPGLTPWVFWTLFTVVISLIGWMVVTALMRPRPMMVYADPTEADLAAFRSELRRRLKKNKKLRDAEIVMTEEADLETGLVYLKSLADNEIRATGKRVFIGTALSQNGRLDTLVVLFLITRMTWRLAKIYNQRPHWRELLNLYANIAATSFLAGSIEEFGIEEYVRELMGPMVGGSALGAVPGAQAIAGTITASVLSGSTNCLLSLRCGIVARDYISLNLDAKGAMRRSATIEASRNFVAMSAETVTYVTKALVKGATGAVKSGSARAVRGVGKTVTCTTEAVGNSARKVGSGVYGAAGKVANTVTGTASKTLHATKRAADTVGSGVKDATSKVSHSVTDSANKATSTTKNAAHAVSSGFREAAAKVSKTCTSTLTATKQSAESITGTVKRTAGKVTQSFTGGIIKTSQTVQNAMSMPPANEQSSAKGRAKMQSKSNKHADPSDSKKKRRLTLLTGRFKRLGKKK